MRMGIEIGGTKLQFGVGTGDSLDFADFQRLAVDPRLGAAGIRDQIALVGRELIRKHGVQRLGIGFGGPVDSARGMTTTSHQIDGWENFPLGQWCEQHLGVPAVLGNDCDVATLAEALSGAGVGKRSVFYVTVGTGIGGGCAVNGRLLGHGRPAVAEIGHLRPGLEATNSHATVESIASGWGIVATARQLLALPPPELQSDAERLRRDCGHDLSRLTAVAVTEAARRGNLLAQRSLDRAIQTLGWGIAQVITLLAPEIVVVGGGVSLIGEEQFFRPLRDRVAQYVFPPLANSYEIAPARLGEAVVVHGALALAAQLGNASDCDD